ncbi:MAG: carboxymuconolactone decarboxylase family protein [Caulobacteraceae bacterium]
MTAPDRLPPIPEDRMTADQKAVVAEILAGPRGSVPAPFAALLRSPELTGVVQRLGEYLRFRSPLPDNVKELAILVVARLWGQRYEWAYHLPLALKAGVGARGLRSNRGGAAAASDDGRRGRRLRPPGRAERDPDGGGRGLRPRPGGVRRAGRRRSLRLQRPLLPAGHGHEHSADAGPRGGDPARRGSGRDREVTPAGRAPVRRPEAGPSPLRVECRPAADRR